MKPITKFFLIVMALFFSGCAVDYNYDDNCYYDYYGGYWCDYPAASTTTVNYVYNEYDYDHYDYHDYNYEYSGYGYGADYVCFEEYEDGCIYLYCYDEDYDDWFQYDVTCL
jgi:hypothetical protein